MDFELDKQTVKDLEIFGNGRSSTSIFNYYNRTKTIGGKSVLQQLMSNPIADIHELQQRCELIRFLANTDLELKINSGQFEFIERYLRLNIAPLRNNFVDAFLQNLSYRIKPNNDYYLIQTGVRQLMYLLVHLKEKTEPFDHAGIPLKFSTSVRIILNFIQNPDFKGLFMPNKKITYSLLNKLDNFFRKKHKNELREVIQVIYSLDACLSVARVAKQKRLAFPVYADSARPVLSIEKLYHPLLENAVPYDVKIKESTNLCFLTGPNMAGKSTFLKSIGLSIYLSHLGFPVPASKMETSVYHGIVTTINLADDMNRGYSHFYSEVKRVKETALMLKEKKRLLVIFDELFRGTNVKDAYDASLLIIESFARIPHSTFFISTHLTEVAEKIGKRNNVQFNYFDSRLIEDIPTYDYKLEDGISHERLGMYILRNEKIIEILDSITNN